MDVLRKLQGVEGVPRLVGVGRSNDYRQWIVTAPEGGPAGKGARIEDLISYARNVAEIIGRLTAAGYIHGDLSHNNIICFEGGGAALVDFGSARRLNEVRNPLR